MPRLAILNMALGFMIVFLAACGGAFVSFDITKAYLYDLSQLQSWQLELLKSAHGHTNLFGLLHLAFGLTFPYSPMTQRWKILQSLGLFSGVLAMGPGMIARALQGPSESFDPLGLTIGLGLSFALVSLGSHSAALFYKLIARFE